MIDEDEAQRHIDNINQHKLNSKQNAQIYYNNKGESLQNSYALNINKNEVVNIFNQNKEKKVAKPPKYPGIQKQAKPQENQNVDAMNEEMKLEYYEQLLEGDNSPLKFEEIKERGDNLINKNKNEILETESENSTLVRADSNDIGNQLIPDLDKDMLTKEEIEKINEDAKNSVLQVQTSIRNDRERFSEKLQKFKFDRSSSPANIQANEVMNGLRTNKKIRNDDEINTYDQESQNYHPNVSPTDHLNKEKGSQLQSQMDYNKK